MRSGVERNWLKNLAIGNGVVSGARSGRSCGEDHRNRSERGAAILPLTLCSHALTVSRLLTFYIIMYQIK